VTPTPHLIERAYQMARSGQFNSVEEMRRQLTVEGYGNIEAHLSGFSIRKDLKALISRARSVI
jgi:hypothetical protein